MENEIVKRGFCCRKFNEQQYRLELLSLTCKIPELLNFLDNNEFQCIKVNGKCCDVLKIYPFHVTIKSLNLVGNVQDSLFINKKLNSKFSFIYISPHLVYIHQDGGRSISEIFQCIPNTSEQFCNIVCIPNHVLRSFDGYSIEFFSDDENNNTPITLGLFLNNDSEQKMEGLMERKIKYFDMYISLLDNIISTFVNTKYLPYFIHPDRLIIQPIMKCIKILSPNLLTYVLAPQNNKVKILNAVYSHPISFNSISQSPFINYNLPLSSVTTNTTNINNNKSIIIAVLNQNILNNIMDFFHSAFVTALWIFTTGRFQNMCMIKRNISQYGNNIQSIVKLDKKIYKKENTQTGKIICTNKYGFCQKFLKNNNNNDENNDTDTFEYIHNYGCLHLIDTAPVILAEALKDTELTNNIENIINAIVLQYKIFKDFIDKLKSISKNQVTL